MPNTTSPTSTNTLAVLNASIVLVATVMPEVGALVLGLKTIWLAANPGKTDTDWIAGLAAASGQLTSDADAQLLADGYVRDPNTGDWKKAVA